MLTWDPKDPNDIDAFQLDWSDRLSGAETLATSSWSVPTGLTQPNSSSFTTTVTTLWLAAGVEDTSYEIVNTITTTGGRTLDQTVRLKVKTR